MTKKSAIYALQLVCVILIAVAVVYFIIYALKIFPATAIAQINNAANGTGSVTGAFGVALASAIAVVVAGVLLASSAVLGLAFDIYMLVVARTFKKYEVKGILSEKAKKLTVLNTIACVMLVALTVYVVALASSTYLFFLPVAIAVGTGTVCWAVQFALLLKKLKSSSVVTEQQ